MLSPNLTQISEKIAPSSELKKELATFNNQLVGKYTWLQIENKNLFFKIMNVVEIRKDSEIRRGEFSEKESKRCGSVDYQGTILPVFDFRKNPSPNDDDIMKSDRVAVLEVDHYENILLIGILFNEIDEIVF